RFIAALPAARRTDRRDLRRIVSMRIDAITRVIELAKERRMRGGQVVAFEVIVHIHLPVAGDRIIAALGKFELIDRASDLRHLGGYVSEHFRERRSAGVLVDEDVRSPGLDSKL